MKRLATILCLSLFLSACSNKGPVAPTEGRQSVVFTQEVAPVKTSMRMNLSKALARQSWPMAYGNAANNRGRVLLSNDLKLTRSVSIGDGVESDAVTIATPVVADGRVYTLDSSFNLQVTDLSTGKQIQRIKLPKVIGTISKSVGLAWDDGRLFAVAGNGLIVSVSEKGDIIWTKELNAPLRSAPIVYKGKLFVSSINNDLFVLKVSDGSDLWQYKGEPTTTNFFGMGVPAVSRSVVVMPTTSGRVNAFDIETGVMLWTETMWTARTFNPFLDLPHVTASPVIENGIVYIVGNAGKTGAYRLSNGQSIFTAEVGGRETPVVSGNVLLMISNQDELMALDKKTGHIYWKTKLFGTDKQMVWKGPLLVGDNAVVTSSSGDVVFFDLESGKEVRRDKQEALFGEAITANGALILTTQDGDMLFYE